MTPDRVAIVGLAVVLAVVWTSGMVIKSQRDEARHQRDYAISRRTDAERDAKMWRDMADANREANAANRSRAESCERLLKMKEMP